MNTELLSPAGDIESAYAAFYYGADAIYLGLRQFSARAEAINFSPEELDEITAYAHAHNKKVYVTLNTVVQETELPDVLKTLHTCAKCHVDAVIVQDLGVARLIKTTFPELALHASTQMAIHNLAGALKLKQMGFSRIVLARELSLSEIQEIQKKADVEIEVFIHGALCYSYSGLCLFSSQTTGRSANRGKCVYSCRDIFRHEDRQSHLFSMKDLALEKEVLKLKGLSLKIEGRKKTPLYVAAVTDYYRRILDTGKTDIALSDNLKQIFARPWTKLHFNGKNKDIIDPDFVGHRGLQIALVDKIFNHTISFKPNRPIARYDGIQIDVEGQEKPFGFSAENLTVNGKKVFEVPAGQTCTLSLPPHHPFIKKGDRIYLASSTRVKGAYHYTKPKPNEYKNRIDIDVSVFVEEDKITAYAQNATATINGFFEPAQNIEKVLSSVRRSFEKTGDTIFKLNELTLQNPKGLFVPASVLNDLRRDLYSAIKITQEHPTLPTTPKLKTSLQKPSWIIKTDDRDLATQITGYDELIYVLSLSDTPEKLDELKNIRLALPTVLRSEKEWQKKIDSFIKAGFNKWEIGNPSGFTFLPKNMDISLDNTVSMLNSQAICEALDMGAKRITFSVEDTFDNIKALSQKTTQTVLVLYQDIPLFLSANCVRENACRDCPKGRLEMALSNGKGRYRLISENCQTTVIDERPFTLPPVAQTLPAGAYRIDFCNRRYSLTEARAIIDRIKERQKIPNTTSGHFEKQFAS